MKKDIKNDNFENENTSEYLNPVLNPNSGIFKMPQNQALALTFEEIEKRFNYHAPTPEKKTLHENVRYRLKQVALDLNQSLPPSREMSLFFTHLEEAMMWANAAIARNP